MPSSPTHRSMRSMASSSKPNVCRIGSSEHNPRISGPVQRPPTIARTSTSAEATGLSVPSERSVTRTGMGSAAALEDRGHERCEARQVRTEDDDIVCGERGIGSEQMAECVAQHFELSHRAVAGVDLHAGVDADRCARGRTGVGIRVGADRRLDLVQQGARLRGDRDHRVWLGPVLDDGAVVPPDQHGSLHRRPAPRAQQRMVHVGRGVAPAAQDHPAIERLARGIPRRRRRVHEMQMHLADGGQGAQHRELRSGDGADTERCHAVGQGRLYTSGTKVGEEPW